MKVEKHVRVREQIALGVPWRALLHRCSYPERTVGFAPISEGMFLSNLSREFYIEDSNAVVADQKTVSESATEIEVKSVVATFGLPVSQIERSEQSVCAHEYASSEDQAL